MTKIAKLSAIGGYRTPNNRRFGRGGLLLRAAAALLALGTLAAPGSARPFQQYLNGTCGGSAPICTINFVKVPAGQRLDVSNVSCYIRLKDGSGGAHVRAAQFLVLGANPNTIVSALTIVPAYVESQFGESIFASNHLVRAFATAQQRFQAYVEIDHGGFSQLACHISGDLTKA
jgi:hypothetical protein